MTNLSDKFLGGSVPFFNYTSTSNPTTTTNPLISNASWLNTATGEVYVCIDNTENANVWVGNLTDFISIACSNETDDLEVATAVVTFRMPYPFTVTDVRASVTTAPTGAAISVDINEGGSSILSTALTIDATEKTSTTAATPAVISDASLADDAEITIDIDQVGSTAAGVGLKVTLIGVKA
jgi:hypothetical protein